MVAITAQTMADEIARQQRLSRSITDLQQSVSSGRKLTSPSQDPQAWVQVSEIGRTQAQQAAWQSNVNYGVSRDKKAQSNLEEMNTLLSRVRESLVTAGSTGLDPAGQAAVVADLQGIRASISDLVNEKDYQGIPVFDDTVSTQIPVARGVNLDVVGTRQSVSEGINLGSGPLVTLDDILAQAIAAVQSGVAANMASALTSAEKGLDHVILAQSVQGIRSDRLDAASNSLTDVDLTLSERRSKLEDTDLTSAIATIQASLLSLEAAQSAFARINRQSLFDLIR